MTVIRHPALPCSVVWRPLTAHLAQQLVNLMWLLSGTGELCGIEYFKLVFLKYLNVPTWSIFTGLVTYGSYTVRAINY